jgi:hypothetical protein
MQLFTSILKYDKYLIISLLKVSASNSFSLTIPKRYSLTMELHSILSLCFTGSCEIHLRTMLSCSFPLQSLASSARSANTCPWIYKNSFKTKIVKFIHSTKNKTNSPFLLFVFLFVLPVREWVHFELVVIDMSHYQHYQQILN